MSDEKQGPTQRPDEDPREPLSQRRPLNHEDDYYDRPLCPCEETEPENQSEYDVAGDWVTYDGPINEDIFERASISAARDLEAQMRAYYQEPVAPPPPSAFAPIPNGDAPEAPKAVDEVKDEWTAAAVEEQSNSSEASTSEAAEKVGAPAQAAEREQDSAPIGDHPNENLISTATEESSAEGNDGGIVIAASTSAAVRINESGTDEVVNE